MESQSLLRQTNFSIDKLVWRRTDVELTKTSIEVFGSAPHDKTIYRSEKYQFLLFFDKFALKSLFFTRFFPRNPPILGGENGFSRLKTARNMLLVLVL